MKNKIFDISNKKKLKDTPSKDCKLANVAVCSNSTTGGITISTSTPSNTISSCDLTKDLTSASTDCTKFVF